MKQTVRTFVAVEICDSARRAAAKLIAALAAAGADVKWVEPHNLHLTLKFLGDVALKETSRVCEAVKQAAAELEPFEFTLAGAGAFPNPQRPRTVWVGGNCEEENPEAMTLLHAQIETRLAKLGFRKDGRRFQPHLTVGRVRGGGAMAELARLIKENAATPMGITTVREVVVFSSQLGREGPTYQAIGRASLGK